MIASVAALHMSKFDKQAVYALLARRFCEKGLNVCLWRDQEQFPRLVGFDMDLICDEAGWRAAPGTIKEALDRSGWHIKMFIQRGHMRTWLVQNTNATVLDNDGSLQIDLHRFLTVAGIPYVDVAKLIARKVVINGAFFLHAVDAACISYIEPILAKSEIKSRYAMGFADAMRREPQRCDTLMREALGSAGMLSINMNAPVARLRYRAIRAALVQRPFTLAIVLWRKIIDGIRSFYQPPGLMISISGPDGAGKSTVIKRVAAFCDRRISIGVSVIHTRPYLLPRLGKFLPYSRRMEVLTTRSYEPKLSQLKSLLRVAILLVDYNLGYWFKLRPQLAAGKLLIFDRYFLDYQIDPRLRGIDLGERALRLIGALVPKTDLTVVLVAAPEILQARKHELSIDEARKQVEQYRSLASKAPTTVLMETDWLSPVELTSRIVERLIALRRFQQSRAE